MQSLITTRSFDDREGSRKVRFLNKRLTRAGITSHRTGDNEDPSADWGADSDEDELEEAEAANEPPAMAGHRVGWIPYGFSPEGGGPEAAEEGPAAGRGRRVV